MSDLNDIQNGARLIALGLEPRRRPVNDLEYRSLVADYRDRPEFAAVVDRIAEGLGLSVLAVNQAVGILLGSTDGSPFAVRLADYGSYGGSDGRLTHGLIHLVIAGTCFPTTAALDDESRPLPQVSVVEIDERLRHLADLVRREVDDGIDPPAGAPELEPLWRLVARTDAVKATTDGRTGSLSTHGMIAKAFRWLTDQGFAEAVSDEDKGTWVMRNRYRIQVRELAAGDAYRVITERLRHVDSEAAP